MKSKAVYLNSARVGAARTWREVAELAGDVLDQHITTREIVRHGSEGPDGFYVEMKD
jgi:hypothetical protein